MWCRTGSQYHSIYQWINGNLPDHGHFQSINLLCIAGHRMRRNSNRNMDSNGCLRQSTGLEIGRAKCREGGIANDDGTGSDQCCMWSSAGSQYHNIYQWINGNLSDHGYLQSINLLCI